MDRRDRFRIGSVVDLQAGGTTVTIADYWIRRFLDCELAITGASGTRLLVSALRRATDATDDPAARDELVTAATHLPHAPHAGLSLMDVADQYLDGAARTAFEDAWPNPVLARTPFDLDRQAMRQAIGMQVFELDTGVRVAAPVEAVGNSVRIDDGTLTVTGVIVSRRLRTH